MKIFQIGFIAIMASNSAVPNFGPKTNSSSPQKKTASSSLSSFVRAFVRAKLLNLVEKKSEGGSWRSVDKYVLEICLGNPHIKKSVVQLSFRL